MQRTYVEGFYTEGLLERPEPEPFTGGDMSVPDDIRGLAGEGGGEYRTVTAPEVIDIDALVAELEGRR
jgi:hypothetical protein